MICFACRLHPNFAEGSFVAWAVPQAESLPLKVKVQKGSIWTLLITKLEAVFFVFCYKGKSSYQHVGLKSAFKLAQKNVTASMGMMMYASTWTAKLLSLLQGSLQCADEPTMSSQLRVRAFLCLLGSMVPEKLEIVGRHW